MINVWDDSTKPEYGKLIEFTTSSGLFYLGHAYHLEASQYGFIFVIGKRTVATISDVDENDCVNLLFVFLYYS
jgi:hypothetical protein